MSGAPAPIPWISPRQLLAALATAVGFALLTTIGAPGVAAPIVSVAGVALGWALGSWARLGRAGPVAGAGLAGVAGSAALLAPGFPLAHDLTLHVWALDSFAHAVAAGDLVPRWHLSLGLGMPLGVFYPPLPFWSGVPFYLAGAAPSAVAKGSLALLHGLAGASMAAAMLHAGRSHAAALGSGVAFTLAPYLAFDLHGRGALGEAMTLVLLPWLLAGMDRALTGRPSFPALLGFGVGLVHTHMLSLVMLAAALPIALLGTFASVEAPLRGRVARAAPRAAVAALIAAALGAHQLVPAVLEADYTALRSVSVGHLATPYAEHAAPPSDLLERRAVDVFVGSLPRAVRQPGLAEMPYYFGAGLLALALCGALGCRRRPGDLFAVWLFGAGVALSVSPLADLWGASSLLSTIQFPWRHLLLSTAAGAWLAGRALEHLATAGREGPVLAAAACALLFVDARPYLGLPVIAPDPEEIVFDASARTDVNGTRSPLRWNDEPLRCEGLLLPPADRRLAVWRSSPTYKEYMTPELVVSYLLLREGNDRSASRAAGVRCEAVEAGVRMSPADPLVELGAGERPGVEVPVRVANEGDTTRWRFGSPVSGRLKIRVQHFPGFEAWDESGRPLPIERCDGLICLDVTAPAAEIVLHFGMTPVRSAGAGVSVATAVALGLAGAWRLGRRHPNALG